MHGKQPLQEISKCLDNFQGPPIFNTVKNSWYLKKVAHNGNLGRKWQAEQRSMLWGTSGAPSNVCSDIDQIVQYNFSCEWKVSRTPRYPYIPEKALSWLTRPSTAWSRADTVMPLATMRPCIWYSTKFNRVVDIISTFCFHSCFSRPAWHNKSYT